MEPQTRLLTVPQWDPLHDPDRTPAGPPTGPPTGPPKGPPPIRDSNELSVKIYIDLICYLFMIPIFLLILAHRTDHYDFDMYFLCRTVEMAGQAAQ